MASTRQNRSGAKARAHWQKNLLKVPQNVLDQVSRLPQDTCVAACPRQIPIQVIKDGVFAHLGVQWRDDGVRFPEQVIPDPQVGRYSRANIEGKERILRDLPMVSATYTVETPNYGDWSLGSHDISFSRDVYQREYIPPRELAIRIERVADDIQKQALIFRFTVDELLDRSAPDFQERLLFDLNLLQENVGNHGIFSSQASMAEYLNTLYVNWELLPPGEREANIARIVRTVKNADPRIRQQIAARYDFLARLRPQQFIRGTNGFRNYFGAQFAPDLVVFENVEYGNAVYMMFEDWASLSQKSRTELLAQDKDKMVRIPHTEGWQDRLYDRIQKERRKRRQG